MVCLTFLTLLKSHFPEDDFQLLVDFALVSCSIFPMMTIQSKVLRKLVKTMRHKTYNNPQTTSVIGQHPLHFPCKGTPCLKHLFGMLKHCNAIRV